MNPNKVRFDMVIDKDQRDRLVLFARQHGVSIGEVVRRAISAYLSEQVEAVEHAGPIVESADGLREALARYRASRGQSDSLP